MEIKEASNIKKVLVLTEGSDIENFGSYEFSQWSMLKTDQKGQWHGRRKSNLVPFNPITFGLMTLTSIKWGPVSIDIIDVSENQCKESHFFPFAYLVNHDWFYSRGPLCVRHFFKCFGGYSFLGPDFVEPVHWWRNSKATWRLLLCKANSQGPERCPRQISEE